MKIAINGSNLSPEESSAVEEAITQHIQTLEDQPAHFGGIRHGPRVQKQLDTLKNILKRFSTI